MQAMKIEIWSDVACPWCFIGKRRFEATSWIPACRITSMAPSWNT
jgi:hypothetical protein